MNRSTHTFLLALLACLTIGLNEAKSQTEYEPLLAEGRIWNVYEGGWVPTAMSYYTGLDSTFDGLVYKELMQLYGGEFEILMGWIREDVQEQKVFLRNTWTPDDPEVMYYDFDVEVGDTVWSALCDSPMTVVELDMVEWANGSTSERIKLQLMPENENFTEYWVEGIGSMHGVLAPAAYLCTADWDPVLCCVTSALGLQFERTEEWIPEHENCDTPLIDGVGDVPSQTRIAYRIEGRTLLASGSTALRVYSRTGGWVGQLAAGGSLELPAAGAYLIQSPDGVVQVVVL